MIGVPVEDWQKLIQILVEIWTDEDIKKGKWITTHEEFGTGEQNEKEFSDESEDQRKSA